ncbi:MAG: TonB-dependent receptor [Candidatus Binatia bacterium]
MTGRGRLSLAMLGIIAGAFSAGALLAEEVVPLPDRAGDERPEVAPPPSSVVDPAARRGIEEIVITARKREERAQDVPIAVTTFGSEQIDRYDVADFTELADMTPQLIATETSSGAGGTVSLRGISTSTTSAGFDQSVAINLDGIHYSNANVLMQGFLDLARVEVLKGPQALFFGKNSPAGVISLTSADPGPELELIGRFGTEFNAEEYWGEAIASGPVTRSLGARLAVQYRTIGGYVKNLSGATTDLGSFQPVPAPAHRNWPGEDQLLGRLTLKWAPTDAIELKVKASGANLDQDGNTGNTEMFQCDALGRAQLDEDEDCNPDRRIRQNDVAPAVARTEPLVDREGGALFAHYDSQTVAATANFRWRRLLLTSLSGFTRYDTQYLGDYDLTGTSAIFVAEDVDRDALSEEIRLLSDLEFPLNFMIGGYWQKTGLLFDQPARVIAVPADPLTGRYVNWVKHSETDGQTFSAFGQLIWDVIPTIEVTPGVRYTHETKDSFSVHRYLSPFTGALFKPVGERLEDEIAQSNVSPEVAIAWRSSLASVGDWTIYGTYKQGFKSGGYDNSAILRPDTTTDNTSYASEKVSGFEGGIKSTWLDGALAFSLIGYTYEFEDLQIHFFDSAAIAFDVQNAASAKTDGFESELRWITPLSGLSLHGIVAYNDAPYEDFLSFCYAGQSYGDGCNLDENGNPTAIPPGVRQDLSGTIRPLAPKWAASFGLAYQRPLPELPLVRRMILDVGADFGYTGRYLMNALGRQVYQDPFVRSDASLKVYSESRRWELALFGRNLSDEYVLFAAIDSPLSGQATGQPVGILADQIGVVNRPREIGLQVTARF